MSWSLKTCDLLRDPRCVLHSAISDPDSAEGELKLYGRAIEAGAQIRDGCRDGWWATRPADAASVFSLNIDQATFISWDVQHGEMTVGDGRRNSATEKPGANTRSTTSATEHPRSRESAEPTPKGSHAGTP